MPSDTLRGFTTDFTECIGNHNAHIGLFGEIHRNNETQNQEVFELHMLARDRHVMRCKHSSFPIMHKVGNVDIFVLPKFKKYDR